LNPAERPTELSPGSRLRDRYEILGSLSEGGMGRVYRARHLPSGQIRALKQTFYSEEKDRAWFRNEAELMSRLDHECIPKVHDYFADGNDCYLAMDLIPGPDLLEVLKSTGKLHPSMVLAWTKKLLDALQQMHSQAEPIIHRDIKPQNIKIHGGEQVYLLDFGLAKAGIDTVVPGVSRNYSSPEQVRGFKTDARSDLYSLGATLCHALTGIAPPDYYERASLATQGGDGLSNMVYEGTLEIWNIVLKALELEPNDRFASAEEMLSALNAVHQPGTFLMRVISHSFSAGAKEAEADLRKGILAIIEFDRGGGWFDLYKQILQKEYGIQFKTEADAPGSVLEGARLSRSGTWFLDGAFIEGYNQVAQKAINTKFGKDISGEVERRVKKVCFDIPFWSNEKLLAMVNDDPKNYSFEALHVAREELASRNVT
jgi:serine/threonine protein kinase